jgi:hypothetical protein
MATGGGSTCCSDRILASKREANAVGTYDCSDCATPRAIFCGLLPDIALARVFAHLGSRELIMLIPLVCVQWRRACLTMFDVAIDLSRWATRSAAAPSHVSASLSRQLRRRVPIRSGAELCLRISP